MMLRNILLLILLATGATTVGAAYLAGDIVSRNVMTQDDTLALVPPTVSIPQCSNLMNGDLPLISGTVRACQFAVVPVPRALSIGTASSGLSVPACNTGEIAVVPVNHWADLAGQAQCVVTTALRNAQ